MIAFEVLDAKIANRLRTEELLNLQTKQVCHRSRNGTNTTKILDWVPDRLGDIQELQGR